jgi:SAM-dependent methyltransferase
MVSQDRRLPTSGGPPGTPTHKTKAAGLRSGRASLRLASLALCTSRASALAVCGLEVPHARPSVAASALQSHKWPDEFPYSPAELRPEMAGGDGAFYLLPKFVQHAGDECRAALRDFYACALPPAGTGAVLDLCSSWTSHYPEGWRGERVVALGLNPLELLANPSKTEWRVQDLNQDPTLPFADGTFDVITNSLSVDYMTSPLQLFAEMARVTKPGGLACCAFTNRCFPSKVVPAWLRPFSEPSHVRIIGAYFRYSTDDWADIGVADVSPPGFIGERDPMIVVVGRKRA